MVRRILYFGPGLAGKTTNLKQLQRAAKATSSDSKLVSIARATDRTLLCRFRAPTLEGEPLHFEVVTEPG